MTTIYELDRYGRPVTSLRGNWDAITDVWDRDRMMLEYWSYAETLAYRGFSNMIYEGYLTLEELQSMALDTLINCAVKWHEWCEEHEVDPGNKRFFYGYLRGAIKYEFLEFKSRRAVLTSGLPDEIGGHRIYTQMRVKSRDSSLHHEIVRGIAKLPKVRRAALALYFYERVGGQKTAHLLGLHNRQAASVIVKSSAARVLDLAYEQVLDNHTLMPTKDQPAEWTQEFRDWTHENYDCDPDSYIEWMQANYHEDVSYLIDMIDNVFGVKIQISTPRPAVARLMRKITDEQIAEILRLQAEGHPRKYIVEQTGVASTTTWNVMHGWTPAA